MLEAWLAGWTSHPHPPFFFLTIRARELKEKRTGRETGQRQDGTGSFLEKESPGAQIHQSVMNNSLLTLLPPHQPKGANQKYIDKSH